MYINATQQYADVYRFKAKYVSMLIYLRNVWMRSVCETPVNESKQS